MQKTHIALALMSAIGLAGCGQAGHADLDQGALAYSARHPIELRDRKTELDIYAIRQTGLDARQRNDLLNFISKYRAVGKGVITIQSPVGGGAAEAGTLRAVKALLQEGGVGRGYLHETTYLADVSAPVRLSFSSVEAAVPHDCGQFPTDLAHGPTIRRNEQHWNFGCAFQTNFANQIADPLDTVRPRIETQADAGRRSSVFEVYRNRGSDAGLQGSSPGSGSASTSTTGSTTSAGGR